MVMRDLLNTTARSLTRAGSRKAGAGDLLDEHMQFAIFRRIRQWLNFQRDCAKTYLTELQVSRTAELRRVLTIRKIATPRPLRLC